MKFTLHSFVIDTCNDIWLVSLHLCIITVRVNERRNAVQRDIEFILKPLFTTVIPRICRPYTNRAVASFTASVEVGFFFNCSRKQTGASQPSRHECRMSYLCRHAKPSLETCSTKPLAASTSSGCTWCCRRLSRWHSRVPGNSHRYVTLQPRPLI